MISTMETPLQKQTRRGQGNWLRLTSSDRTVALAQSDSNKVTSRVVEYFAQVSDMLRERTAALRAHTNPRLRFLLLEPLFDQDITCLLQRLEVRTEVSVGCSNKRLEPGKFDGCAFRRERVERRHDLQPHGLVNNFVAPAHRGTPVL